MILSLEKVSLTYVVQPVLKEVDFVVEEKDKWGVIGLNGAGKSTLLKLMAGIETPDSGKLQRVPGYRIAYCGQDCLFDESLTIEEAVRQALDPRDQIEDFKIHSILTKLGFKDLKLKIALCSGGQKKRVALAAALIQPADLYLLDEPTNHLDQEMILWLEKFLIKMNKALILVTHDRYFLNRITNKMVEVENGRLYTYKGNYADFLEQKEKRRLQLLASEQKRQNFLRTEIEWIRRGAQARSTKSKERIARFEKIQAIEAPKEKEKLKLESTAARLGRKTIELTGVSKAYGDKVLFENFSYLVKRHDRIGIIGGNGCGKTTLLKMIVQQTAPDCGKIEIGETVRIGYFAQTSGELDPNQRIIDYIRQFGEVVTTASKEEITASQLLERFLFSKDRHYLPIAKCSGGEKRRLILCSILMQSPNILLLDEPTNDLDTETLTILEDYLENFPGALLAVSHDRYFLDKTCDQLFVFENGKISVLTMDYSSYLEKREESEEPKEKKPEGGFRKEVKPVRLSYQEKKELAQLTEELPVLEARIARLEEKLIEESDNYALLEKTAQELQLERTELEEKTERWMELSEKAGE